MRNMVLIGLPGCGKTTLGARAAKILNLEFLDLDWEIERRAGISVAEIFSRFGEDRFREMESEAVERAAARSGLLIAAGGGVVTREKNLEALRESRVIFIDRPVERIMESVSGDGGRPLLSGDPSRLHRLSRERRELYMSAADMILPNEGGEEDGLRALLALIRSETVTDGYAVIGEPILHSLSPVIHGAIFSRLGINQPYRALQVPTARLSAFADRVRRTEIQGFNVTIPHKRAIMPLLDEIEPEATLCGAVNTVVHSHGRLVGFNTDMEGLQLSLKDAGGDFTGRSVLILGAGGAAGAVARKAAGAGAAEVTILARRPERAEAAAARARGLGAKTAAGPLTPGSIARAARRADLLINGTPLGMHGYANDFESFDFLAALPSSALVCDLIYAPARTALLAEAEKKGLAVMNGLGMLIHQAILADELYLQKRLDRARLYEAAAAALARTA